MKQTHCLLPALLIFGFSVKAQTLQSVTTAAGANSTSNFIRVTGVDNIPTLGKGMEMYFSGGHGILTAYDRDNSTPVRMRIQPLSQGGFTTINDMGGRLLINTSTDDGTTPLQLNGGMRMNNGMFKVVSTGTAAHGMAIYNDETGGGRTVLAMDANGGDIVGLDYFIIQHFAGNTGVLMGTANAAPMKFQTGNAERMRIDGAGNVVIGSGTPKPEAKLTVDGTVFAKKVKVTTSLWADHVFHPEYKLPTLHELEAYIGRHRHLPDIPSEKEVREQGIDVGESQAKLLQKIEELTLYIIELNKKVERQENELKKLKER